VIFREKSAATVEYLRCGIRHVHAEQAAILKPARAGGAMLSGREDRRRPGYGDDRRLDDLEQLGGVEIYKKGGNKACAEKHEQEDGARSVYASFVPSARGVRRSACVKRIDSPYDDALCAGRDEFRIDVCASGRLGRAHCQATVTPLGLLVQNRNTPPGRGLGSDAYEGGDGMP
jgi:hypothetical protein